MDGAPPRTHCDIDPDVPADKRFSVMIHEYSHVLQVQIYGSNDASAAAMSAVSGMSATAANESTADCMALMQGRHLGGLRLPGLGTRSG